MKNLLIPVLCSAALLTANAELTLKEIRTASKDVLVAYFTSTKIDANEVNTNDLSAWKLNGQPVIALHKFVTEADACDHYIYLEVPMLVSGTKYTLQTPHGDKTFIFDERSTFCESIKSNQSGYSALSKVRYANFAIWLGDGGSRQISGDLPSFTVFKVDGGSVVAQGTLRSIGQDASSGDFVYRIDLSSVPEGGPYKIAVKGYGCSYPFGVGGDFSRRLGQVAFRSLYHQRCGCPIVEPYAWNIKPDPCHTTIYQVNGPIGEARLVVTGDEPTFTAYGGYHDAGDADRRTYHMDVPITLMTTYEAFPQFFTDDQFNIPDKFDQSYHILGKGNGIPDILDEALWGTMFWEYMQETNGTIHWGTETKGYSPFTTYANDPTRFGTEVVDPRSASFASGMFLHLARLLKPYNPARAQELQKHAEMAYAAAGDRIRLTHKLYYAVQKYLLTGEEAAHQTVKDLAASASEYANTFNRAPESFADRSWLASYFYSYLVAKDRPTDPAVVDAFKAALKAAADKELGYLSANAYPVGTPPELRWWGSNLGQGQYAYPCLLYWSLTKEQKYIDAVSQLMDYAQGLNPLGKCFMTGLGFNRVHNPHDRESAYTKKQGWGSRPGILVFGPGGAGRGVSVPLLSGLARERKYIDNLGSIQWSEFTVYQSLCFPSAVYPVLAQGGKYNPRTEPFAMANTTIDSGSRAPYPNCVQIFNGINFEGWEAAPSTWSITNGAMRGVGGTSRLAYTKADYGSFRLIFTARMNPVNGDHLGVLFWGDRPKDTAQPKIDDAGWIQFMPPFGGMWSYHPPLHHNLPHETVAPGSKDSAKWTTTELLCNLEKGTMRAAVDGVEIARYSHPNPTERTDPEKRIVPGPIGMFRHGGGASEYKDIYVEANPKEDKLITVK